MRVIFVLREKADSGRLTAGEARSICHFIKQITGCLLSRQAE